jgi:hypothetical protein
MNKFKHKFDCSIFFLDDQKNRRFLFRLTNYGKETDELKLFFFLPDMDIGFNYNESVDTFTESDLIGQYAELTYHHDGSLLFKFPEHIKNGKPLQKNPAGMGTRRTPLSELRDWESFVRYTIVDYSSCKIIETDNLMTIFRNGVIFGGDPFVCNLYLGHMAYANPPNSQPTEMIYRINDVASNIDLILWSYKTDYQGKLMRVGESDLVIRARNNLIEIIEKKQ